MHEVPPIAQAPASPRDHSKLLVYRTETDEVFLDRFLNIDAYLPKNSFLVCNKTKVVPARLKLRKETGGKVEALFLMNEFRSGDTVFKALLDREVLLGKKLTLNNTHTFIIEKQEKNIFTLRPLFPSKIMHGLLEKFGYTPIPPYIRNTPLNEKALRKKYQTVFAKQQGSVAAPTASLHFTDRIFRKLDRKNIPRIFVTLHIGLGTFAPVTEENLKQKKLFEEWYEISASAAQQMAALKKSGRTLIAVGTTAVRTLESYSKTGIPSGSTNLFITPPYSFKLADGLITNFHLQGSSLRYLVEAFLQHKKSRRNLRDLYDIAMKNKFRFYSFGDAMCIV